MGGIGFDEGVRKRKQSYDGGGAPTIIGNSASITPSFENTPPPPPPPPPFWFLSQKIQKSGPSYNRKKLWSSIYVKHAQMIIPYLTWSW